MKEGVARFLSEEEYEMLAGTHASVPAIIDALNNELNELRKKQQSEQDAGGKGD